MVGGCRKFTYLLMAQLYEPEHYYHLKYLRCQIMVSSFLNASIT